MANPPTVSITVTYISVLPNTTAQVNLPIPAGLSYDQLVSNIRINRGFWLPNAFTFIPFQQIVNIVAQ
jgi:hypothetical protein